MGVGDPSHVILYEKKEWDVKKKKKRCGTYTAVIFRETYAVEYPEPLEVPLMGA